jgi:hypothetical protein
MRSNYTRVLANYEGQFATKWRLQSETVEDESVNVLSAVLSRD